MTRIKLDRLCILLILISGSLVGICQTQSLSVLGQKSIRPFATYEVCVTNTLPKAVNLELKLTGDNMDQVKNISMKRDYQKRVPFKTQNIEGSDYSLSIRSLDPSVDFSETIDLILVDKSFLIFIQIDKPIYKPGDTMSFRVIVVDADTRPVTHISNIEVSLKDSKDTSIRDWPFAKLRKGVFESSVVLPSSPNLGNWSLTVGSREVESTKFFEVKPYVLPKFWIKVYPTETPLLESKSIKLTVESCFTFDRPVSGQAQVDLYLEKLQNRADHSTTKPIERISTFEFFLKDEIYVESDMDYHDVLVNVTVTETHTNTTLFVLEPIRVYRNAFDITLSKWWPMFRPGMKYPMVFTFKDKQGNAACIKQTVNIKITYRQTNEDEDENEVEVSGIIDNKGLLSLTNIIPPKTAKQMTVKIQHKSVEFEEDIEGAVSLSNQYLRINMHKNIKRLHPNGKVEIEIVCSEAMKHFTYVLVARGNIFDSGLVKVNRRKEYKLKITLKPILAPKAHIIVFYTNKQYMIWDDMELNFDAFENNLKLTLDKEKYNPGKKSYIDVEAAPDSFVAFHAIDQSVSILDNSWNDLTRANILKKIDTFDEDESGLDHFQPLGLFLRTTSTKDSLSRVARFGFSNAKEILHIRTVFPETWLWQNLTMAGKTETTFAVQVPDTITSWRVTGFALSPTAGLGIIDEPVRFTVEQTFYIVAHLPYSIKRGEVTVVQVMIYNFLGNTLITDVYLYNKNDEIEFVDEVSRNKTLRSKAVMMPGNGAKQVTYLIKAKKIGEIAVKIEAKNSLKEDSVEHILRVEPESYTIVKNEPRLIDHEIHTSSKHSFSIDIDRHAISDSLQIRYSLDPSFLRIPIQHVNELIETPKQYGEANMVDFIPHVVILEYFEASGIHDEILKNRIINNLKTGYQNQLKYKLNGECYCVWNTKQNKKGNVFVTALVARSFKIASKHLEMINNSAVESALKWLASKQKEDGSFVEVGDKIHNELQGVYRPSSYALTAYVLAAFLEIDNKSENHATTISNATNFLKNNLDSITDLYDLALTAYALSLKKHDLGKRCLDKLIEESILQHGKRYWDKGPVSIEIASYAMLTILQYHSVVQTKEIMNWLTEQRTVTGGFSSIQNTFIGLRAMAQYSKKTSLDKYDYRVLLKWKNSMITFDIDKYNARNNYSLDIPSNVRLVDVEIDGIGFGLYQVAYQFRHELENAKKGFDLRLELVNSSTYHVQDLKVCTKYLKREQYTQSNLAYVEVFFPSGFHVEDEIAVKDLSNLSSEHKIMNIELYNRGTNVRVYYNSIGDFESCFTVTAKRRYNVALHRPAHVVVYDNVDRSKFAIEKYDGIVNQPCDICQDEDCKKVACNSG